MAEQRRRRASAQDYILKGPRPETWSAVMPVDKEILTQYIDACELIKETERDIQRLRQRRKVILQDSVKGSMHEFPYAAQSYHIEGLAYATVQTPSLLDD